MIPDGLTEVSRKTLDFKLRIIEDEQREKLSTYLITGELTGDVVDEVLGASPDVVLHEVQLKNGLVYVEARTPDNGLYTGHEDLY